MYTETGLACGHVGMHSYFQIPVFRGAASCLVGTSKTSKIHFGTDGLGDVLQDKDSDKWKTKIQEEHAVHALIRLVNENPGQVGISNE